MRNTGTRFALIIGVFLTACTAGNQTVPAEGNESPDAAAVIRFKKTEHNLGIITQGEKVGYTFMFTNEGESSLLILEARASCGCTVPRFSREPIHPGESGTIEVVFDSSGRIGRQSKSVTIQSNGKDPMTRLTIKAEIVNSES